MDWLSKGGRWAHCWTSTWCLATSSEQTCLPSHAKLQAGPCLMHVLASGTRCGSPAQAGIRGGTAKASTKR